MRVEVELLQILPRHREVYHEKMKMSTIIIRHDYY